MKLTIEKEKNIVEAGYKWKPSKAARKEFGNKMREIEDFCKANGISKSSSMDSYYFNINGVNYRVSNHSVEKSNAGAFDDLGNRVRDTYHKGGRGEDTVYIHAGKTRIIDIYNNLKAGKKLDGFGNPIR